MKQNLREILENQYRITDVNSLDSLISKAIIDELNLGIKPNINTISEKTFTNKSTISRFAKKNGFEGYKQFIELLWIEEANYYKNDKNHDIQEVNNDEFLNVISDINRNQLNMILLADLIDASNDIFIFNSYQNEDVAELFSSSLSSIGKKVTFVKNTFKQQMSSFVKKDSLVICLVSGTDNWTMQKIYNNIKQLSNNTVVIGTKSQTIKFDSPKLKFEFQTPDIVFREVYKKIWFTCFASQILNMLLFLNDEYKKNILSPKFKY